MSVANEFGSGASALLVAHPGHEALIHGWLEINKPVVFALSDGSGGAAASRVNYSRALVTETGAHCGNVFGHAADARWYKAILEADLNYFLNCQRAIADDIHAAGIRRLVCDPIEFYNPMHDLANAMAWGIANSLAPDVLPVHTFNLVNPLDTGACAVESISLSPDMQTRKRSAIDAYTPLQDEAQAQRAKIDAGLEIILEDEPFEWPEKLAITPGYEQYGSDKIDEGRYDDLIRYTDHVRPIALGLINLG